MYSWQMAGLLHLSGCSVLLLIGIVIFLRGFFPIKPTLSEYASRLDSRFDLSDDCLTSDAASENPECFVQSSFDRVVVVLIDALRTDFVLPNVADSSCRSPRMNFVCNLIQMNNTISFHAVANPPTVTLPRIKALMTGTIPGFVDVVLNFDTKALKEDSLLLQLNKTGKRIVFYGDDTWIRLFPGIFQRSEGTTSFFVTDFTEVDDNVTRHLNAEFDRRDWDVLVLHYLGLDHIGHLAGPRSPLIQPKLDEMDGIVKHILQQVLTQDAVNGTRTLVVLCGDHGMSDQGSHGGSTPTETATPIVLLSSLYQHGKGAAYSGQKIQQIDLVPTLSLLLGVPLPSNSLGVVAMDTMTSHDIADKLKAAYINAQQVLRIVQRGSDDFIRDEGYQCLEVAVNMHRQWLTDRQLAGTRAAGEKILGEYMKAIETMRTNLLSMLVSYDIHAMFIGAASVWIVFCLLATDVTSGINNSLLRLIVAGVCSLAVLVHLTVCTRSSSSRIVCGAANSTIMLILSTVYALVIAALGLMVVIAMSLLVAKSRGVFWQWITRQSGPSVLLWSGVCLHTTSLLSSSFVEEEHQTWYFLTVTMCILTIVYVATVNGRNDCCVPGDGNMSSVKPCDDRLTSAAIAAGILLALLCRLARTWNQTGDKWSHLPDVGDWLVRPDNRISLSCVTCVGLVVSVLIAVRSVASRTMSCLFTAGATCVYCHHAASKSLVLPLFYTSDHLSQGIYEARVVYLAVFFLVCFAIVLYRSDSSFPATFTSSSPRSAVTLFWRRLCIAWLLLMLLLARPHNVFLVAMVTVQEQCCQQIVASLGKTSTLPATVLSLVYMFMGQAAFYYQGNSNSLATVDIAAGYVGLDSYNPVLIGTLMCLNIYSMPIYWLLSLQTQLSVADFTSAALPRYLLSAVNSCRTMLTVRSLTLSLYILLVSVERYHLFVWTVFSPKLLYESMLTFVMSIFMIACLTTTSLLTVRSFNDSEEN